MCPCTPQIACAQTTCTAYHLLRCRAALVRGQHREKVRRKGSAPQRVALILFDATKTQ